jgi:magnesium transporter
MNFNAKKCTRADVGSPEECLPFINESSVTWINVDGIRNHAIVETFGDLFAIHPLVLEDITDTAQRPKIEDYGDQLYIVVKMLTCNSVRRVDPEQVSIVLGRHVVITFQEREGDVFDPLRDRILNAKGRVRGMGADFLAYALVDAVVDHYFVILETFGDEFTEIEEELIEEPSASISAKLHTLRRDLVFLRRSVWPLREVMAGIERNESRLFKKGTLVFVRDLYDHTVQVIDAIETYRDILSGMFDIYLSSISYRMNAVMKVLTIISTIFIPLTFISGLYGMNFAHMPELRWKWGYPAVLGVMAAVAAYMVRLFRRKKWL